MKVFVLFTSDTFPGFNVFFKGILYINLSTIHPMVKTVGFLVDFNVNGTTKASLPRKYSSSKLHELTTESLAL
jgi:hypothetical protein